MRCEKKHKKLANRGEEVRPEGTCGAEMDVAASADGQRIYGYVCRACGASVATCEACGKTFVNLDRHMFDSAGGERECYANAPTYRTARAVRFIGKMEK